MSLKTYELKLQIIYDHMITDLGRWREAFAVSVDMTAWRDDPRLHRLLRLSSRGSLTAPGRRCSTPGGGAGHIQVLAAVQER
jgi:hypothetical protein